MITESALQPILSAIFLLAGAAAYVPMIIIGWLPVLSRMPVLKHILEGYGGCFTAPFSSGSPTLPMTEG